MTDQTDAGDCGINAPPAAHTVVIDGRNGAMPNATDFLSQTAQASEHAGQGIYCTAKCSYFFMRNTKYLFTCEVKCVGCVGSSVEEVFANWWIITHLLLNFIGGISVSLQL